MVSRRGLFVGSGGLLATALLGKPASATIARSLSLQALVRGSRRVAIVTALAAESHFEELGRRRRIVTDTRVRIEEHIAKEELRESEVLVRTLGGSVGRLGELVHGQAQLVLGEPCVAFLLQGPDGLHYFNGMAQGHYPLSGDAGKRLLRSPDLPELLNFEGSAVKALVGSELAPARERIRTVVSKP